MNNRPEPSDDLLQRRLDHVEGVNRKLIFALELAASMVHLHGESCYVRDSGRILDEAFKFLDRIRIAWRLAAFFQVNEEDSSFQLARCYPEEKGGEAQGRVDELVENGQFSWALNQNRPILIRPERSGETILMHVLSTKTRVRGMFVGVLENEDDVCTQDGVLSLSLTGLLSIIFHNAAYALESAELYHLMDDLNHRLERGMRSNIFRLMDSHQELDLSQQELMDLNRALVREIKARDEVNRRLRESEERLRDALRVADLANRAKRDFLANVSHEIRTPMNSVIGMADLLTETSLDSGQRRLVQTISSAGEILIGIINDILDMSQIESGQLKLEQVPFSLRREVEGVCAILQPNAHRKGLALTWHLDPRMPDTWRGDAIRLRQILTNLLSNAVKFTHHGAIRLEVSEERANTGETSSRQGGVHIRVEDTGIGIPPENLEMIFDRFVQSDSSITRRFGGSGLGLAITRHLVAMMGGRIRVESQVGVGSCFDLVIPLEQPEPEEESCVCATPCPPERPPCNLTQNWRILVAEDSEDNRLLIQTYLSNTACLLTVVEDGVQAVEVFTRGAFDLVLMDMQMPMLDGLSATRHIRQWEQERQAPSTPIVALTADAMNEHVERSLQAGCNAHLSKPIRKRTLLEAINHWCTYKDGTV